MRLTKLRPHVERASRVKFGPASPKLTYAKTLLDISSSSSTWVVVTGIAFRDMRNKPSILKLYDDPSVASETHKLIPDDPGQAKKPMASASDTIYLEDEHARVVLDTSDLSAYESLSLVTGIVVACKGRELPTSGTFKLVSVSFAGPPPPRAMTSPIKGSKYACFVSALSGPRTHMLAAYLSGMFAESNVPGSVAMLVIAGLDSKRRKGSGPGSAPNGTDEDLNGLKQADAMLTRFASIVPVVVM
ncbi:MAG: hypothetical protein AAGG44_13865, partial [Planctomycetota bacterium]